MFLTLTPNEKVALASPAVALIASPSFVLVKKKWRATKVKILTTAPNNLLVGKINGPM